MPPSPDCQVTSLYLKVALMINLDANFESETLRNTWSGAVFVGYTSHCSVSTGSDTRARCRTNLIEVSCSLACTQLCLANWIDAA